jgi:hypothetical protein
MGATLVRTLLDYWAPEGSNSAADLVAQLEASQTAPNASSGPEVQQVGTSDVLRKDATACMTTVKLLSTMSGALPVMFLPLQSIDHCKVLL